MITKEQLEAAQEALKERCKPAIAAYKEAERLYKEQVNAANAPFLELLEEYYNEQLTDTEGTPIEVGSLLHQEGTQRIYKVVGRGMQILFGTMLFNPSIYVVRVDGNGKAKPNARETNVMRSECKQYLVI